jgi:hypothetical protein
MTMLQEAYTVWDLMVYANVSTNNILFTLLITATFFIMIMSLKRFEFIDVLMSSGFVCFIISIILSYEQLINILVPLAFLAVTAIAVLISTLTK